MIYEVENKFPVPAFDAVLGRLQGLGWRLEPTEQVEQVDHYFAHPVRDFQQTDEALRVRVVGEENFITYKGPKLDHRTKTRRELELPLGGGSQWTPRYCELLIALGFRLVAQVRKRRSAGQLTWQQWLVHVALDEVDGLGKFIELEMQVSQPALEEAQQSLLQLAEQVGLSRVERRSYLEMILAKG
jgi:adenylate cyclase, class 2